MQPEPTLSITAPDGRSETIDLSQVKTLTDPNCQHQFVDDPSDETEFYIAQVCKFCPVGRLSKKA